MGCRGTFTLASKSLFSKHQEGSTWKTWNFARSITGVSTHEHEHWEHCLCTLNLPKRRFLDNSTLAVAPLVRCRRGRQKVLIPKCHLTGTLEERSSIRSYSGMDTSCIPWRGKIKPQLLFGESFNFNFFFILWKQSIYFYMSLSYTAYAIPTLAFTFLVLAGECVTLHCDSRPSYTASWSVWDAAHAWYLPIIHCFFHIPYVVM